METIVIDRSKWRTGGDDEPKYGYNDNRTGIGETSLRNDDGCLCCLGFITEHLIPDYGLESDDHKPSSCSVSIPHLSYTDNSLLSHNSSLQQNTELANQAMAINDDIDTTPEEKEELLKELFKGIFNLEFINEFNYYDD